MAQVKDNIVIEGLSGKFGGKMVFRQRGGKTIVSAMPKMPEERSEAQEHQSNKFRDAVKYARYVLKTPALLATYIERAVEGKSPYHLAISDYLKPPVITDVYQKYGVPSEKWQINIQASDDHLLTEVQLSIYQPDGNLLEQGHATHSENGEEWGYRLHHPVSDLKGHRVRILVMDLPGNTVVREEVIS